MNPDEKITIIWQGEEVGVLLNPMPDMWYLDGSWVSNNSVAANAFEALAKKLEVKETSKDWGKGIDVQLKDEAGQIRGLVLCLTEQHSLYLRRITYPAKFDKEYRSNSKPVLNKTSLFQQMLNFIVSRK
ncbi:hypothetical protein [Hymenobacter bucti]|uniref:Uncharacterized protein n=1 Tax=Hymenobacter bucti TaxID=1844114 RepID=A0ABW4QRG2_9BACT